MIRVAVVLTGLLAAAACAPADRRIRGLGRGHLLDPVMFLEELWLEER